MREQKGEVVSLRGGGPSGYSFFLLEGPEERGQSVGEGKAREVGVGKGRPRGMAGGGEGGCAVGTREALKATKMNFPRSA